MPASIHGYEYDIFVSYRQKDNLPSLGLDRHEAPGWVTDFVNNLKLELAVTFKEEISVYFDENIHDGILETHEVHDTLKEKLKCLIFIPIVSQTYCDPHSFAWKNEFLSFKAFANKDAFGLKIKLHNGNFASRILPVRIHELDSTDTALLAQELGGTIRSVDFIYKAPGINRPLLPSEARPQQNQLKTFYRDQVNKVANHIKEIINGLKNPKVQNQAPKIIEVKRMPVIHWQKTIMITVVILTIFAVSAWIFQQFNREDGGVTQTRTTIAVLPFKIIGNDEDSRYFADGMEEAIRTNLSRFPDLKVKSSSAVEAYRNSGNGAMEIAKDLSAHYLLEGSAQKVGSNIRVIVRLIDNRSDVVWSQRFDKKFEDVFSVLNQISESIAQSLKTKINPEVANEIIKPPTLNFVAYDLFLRAKQAGKHFQQTKNAEALNQAIALLNQSIQLDPDFASCYGWLSGLYMVKNINNLPSATDSIVLLANRALALDSSIVEANVTLSELYYMNNEDVNALRYTYGALEFAWLDSLSAVDLLERLSSIYLRIGDTDQALYVLDKLISLSPDNENLLYKKVITLAADHKVDQLSYLKNEIMKAHPTSQLLPLIDLHLGLEKNSCDDIVKVFQDLNGDMGAERFEQYGAIMAYCLKQKGRAANSQSTMKIFEDQLGHDSFYRAQIELHNGNIGKAMALLENETVGWYNLNLIQINPLMVNVTQTTGFKSFLEKNKTRMLNLQERVHQLEVHGFLKKPELFFETFFSEGELGK